MANTDPKWQVPKTVLPRIPWPAIAPLPDARVLSLLFQLEQSERWPAELLLRHQFRQLKTLCEFAVRQIPFYADRLPPLTGTAADLAAWRQIPLLSRDTLQSAPKAIHAREIPKSHAPVGTVTTSGSTGKPVTLLSTGITGLMYQACVLRSHVWHGRDFSGTLCGIRFLRPDDPAVSTEGKRAQWSYGFNTGAVHSLDVQTPVDAQVQWLRQHAPRYLLTHPTNLELLLNAFQDARAGLPSLHHVSTLGEIVTPELRQLCESVLGVPIVDLYSTMEVGAVAIQCPQYEHYHVQSEHVLVEVLNDAGQPCEPGETGRIVVTDLHNLASPIIRYDLGDFAEVGAACPCGRGLPVLSRIVGRVRSALRMPDGSRRWPGIKISQFADIAPVKQMQFIQTAIDQLTMRLVVAWQLTPAEASRLIARVREQLGGHLHVTLEFVDEIPRSAGGKYHDFICEMGE